MITAAMVLGFMNANAQSPEKIEQLKDTISQNGDEKLLSDLRTATGVEWSNLGDASAGGIFDFSPDEPKAPTREFEKVDVGPYAHIAKVSHKNRQQGRGLEYNVDIQDRAYMTSNIFKRIKELNSHMKNAEITFSMKGTPLPTKTINL